MAIYPKQLFVVRCPSFLFSKLVRRLVQPSGYIYCEKCLALKYTFRFTKVSEVQVFLLLESIDCKK